MGDSFSFGTRLRHAWNAFRYDEKEELHWEDIGAGYSTRPDRVKLRIATERSILSSIINRIGVDVAAIPIRHVRLKDEVFSEIIPSSLNNCLTLDANLDQTGRALMLDATVSLCDEGCVAIVPVDTTIDPTISGSYDIVTLRVAKIVEWFPQHVRVNIYNQKTGFKKDITLEKKVVAIIENPLYSVMNEANSTLQRLITKLNLLDFIDKQSGSGKLDLIIQLPYIIKTQRKKEQAEERKQLIEQQLQDSKYGIGYIDATERITQLNRPAENNLLKQIEMLTSTLYSQLGITQDILDGTADENTLNNYYNTTIEPILSAFTDEMTRKFVTKTGRTQGQAIVGLRDPFRFIPVGKIGEIADKFTRNAILSSNEVRHIVGRKPSSDPEADKLSNKNLNQPTQSEETPEAASTIQNGRSPKEDDKS